MPNYVRNLGPYARKVIDPKTGKTWESINKAARDYGICASTLKKHLEGGRFFGKRIRLRFADEIITVGENNEYRINQV